MSEDAPAAAGIAPSAARVAWAASALGVPAASLRWRRLAAREGPTALWELGVAGGPGWILKEHLRGRGFAQEQGAYATWRRAGLGPWLADLIAAEPAAGGLGALLLGRLPGRPCAGDGEPADHRMAGEFLAALGRVDADDRDLVTPAAALARRVEAACERGRGVAPAACARLAAAARELDGAAIGARVLAHRDFGPWNWLVDDRRGLAVVDLEHARVDLPLVDLVRLGLGPWRRRPALASAFFAGYGRDLTAAELTCLEVLMLLDAVTTLTWSALGRPAHLLDDAAAYLAAAAAAGR